MPSFEPFNPDPGCRLSLDVGIRPTAASDLPELAALQARHYGQDAREVQSKMANTLALAEAGSTVKWWVACNEDRVIGSARVHRFDADFVRRGALCTSVTVSSRSRATSSSRVSISRVARGSSCGRA